MSQQDSVSPFITQIEDVYQLSTTLRDAGYHSVFDVVRVPRKQFINQHTDQFGDNTAAVYELATGFATQISRLYRENESSNRAQNKPVFQSGLQSLQQSGPTWLGLFDDNWAAFCLASSPEANDSPVSYLTWLYNEALGYESTMKTAGGTGMITLAERRPDLATLKLDDNAINQVIPSLQLVNEVLENVIKADIATTTTLDKTLAITRYPNLLPYHYAHEQTILSLDDCYQSLRDVISQVDDSWPYFIQPSLSIGNSGIALELGSNLAPEQQTIVTEADNSEASDLTDFYTENFGITATDYNALAELDVFAQATGLSAPQVEQLLSTNAGGSLAIQSLNYLPTATPPATPIAVDPSVYGSVFVNDGLTPAISIITTHQSKEQDCGQNPVTDASYDSPLLFPATASTTHPPASKPGLFGQSLALYNVANSYAYVDATSNAAATMNGDAHDFSLGFWMKFSHLSSDNEIPLFANSDINGQTGTFCCTLKTNGNIYLLCQDILGSWTSTKSADVLSTNIWYYIAFTWDKDLKLATLYYGTRTSELKNINIDFATDGSGDPTGSMATATDIGYTWVFNDAGNFEYYGSQYKTPKILVETQYDDIIVAWSCLKEEEVAAIISSDFPADGSKYEHYYPLNRDNISLTNLSDSRMDRINRITRLQRWLELPYDQVDKLLTYPLANYIPDSCPTANPFVLENNPTVSSNSMFDGAITFDSTAAQWAYINNDISKSTTPDWSVSMWINIQSADSSSGALVLVSYGESHLSLLGNSLQFVLRSGSMDFATLSANTWYHLLYSFHVESIYYCCYVGCADSTGEIIASLYTDGMSGQVGDTLSFNCSYDGSEPTAGYIVSYDDITLWNYGFSQEEGDALLANIQPACGKSDMLHYYPLDKMYNDVSSIRLKTLGVFQHFQQKYNINAYEFSAAINEITPYAIAPNVPFLDQLFNSPSLFETPFTITNTDFTYTLTTATEVDARIVKQICAGLDISEAQFLLLANLIYSKQPGTNANQLSCSLAVISTFYRLVMLPRWLGLSFSEGLSLFSIIGNGSALSSLVAVPVISALDDSGLAAPGDILSILMAASDAADWLRQHGLSASKIYGLL
ncbi:Tc toxin subunit A [Edaphovirga cremea]|uniref:Tc toxin subunit A n=1 Tax=Edaphovirga cremea TaxID=2267246 RepID=UPI0014733805|nr:Tc toxin subunit A [Edaphovirga cremea]